jgi:hypothetical protein
VPCSLLPAQEAVHPHSTVLGCAPGPLWPAHCACRWSSWSAVRRDAGCRPAPFQSAQEHREHTCWWVLLLAGIRQREIQVGAEIASSVRCTHLHCPGWPAACLVDGLAVLWDDQLGSGWQHQDGGGLGPHLQRRKPAAQWPAAHLAGQSSGAAQKST